MRKRIFAVLFFAFCPLLIAQQAAQQTMDTDAVVKLEKAGVPDSVIIDMVETSPCSFDTSANGVIDLQNAGVHSGVLIAIINRMSALAHPRPAYSPAPAAAPTDPNDPLAPHDAGVYLMDDSPGGGKMIFMDRVGESAMKVSNLAGAAFSFGAAKVKLKAEIPGAHAAVRTTEKRPVFYMYFPDLSSFAAFGGAQMVTSPNQFSLLALDEQKQNRETVIARMGMGGGSFGADATKTVLFTTDRVRPHIYKIEPSADLKPGEYAFIAVMPGVTPETPPSTVVYDFGVDAK